jgi:hypothetical protein
MKSTILVRVLVLGKFLAKGMGGPPHPGPLLHKVVEERETARGRLKMKPTRLRGH